jgi:hypothetical protein
VKDGLCLFYSCPVFCGPTGMTHSAFSESIVAPPNMMELWGFDVSTAGTGTRMVPSVAWESSRLRRYKKYIASFVYHAGETVASQDTQLVCEESNGRNGQVSDPILLPMEYRTALDTTQSGAIRRVAWWRSGAKNVDRRLIWPR